MTESTSFKAFKWFKPFKTLKGSNILTD